ncbi:MAG: hypothetical protein AAF692_05300 [Pseudomonadota bacterium]
MSETRVSFPKPCDQPWDAMARQGCDRRCEVCDQTVFDLEKLTFDEAEALLDARRDVCVRAKVASDGTVALAPGPTHGARAFKTALSAAATLALAACATPNGAGEGPTYSVSGKVPAPYVGWTFELVSDTQTYTARPGRNSRFKFKRIEPGVYRLNLLDPCEDRFDLGEIEVTSGNVKLGDVRNEDACYTVVVGKIEREEQSASG